jgi:2-polyprenyl-3-methyl-5-hydroxy-6-metoxy-1,4-benzoquinol methylase
LNTICYLCGSSDHTIIFQEHDIPILQCKDCSHVFSSYEQEEHYDGYWGEGQEVEFDLDWWDHAHRKIYKTFIDNFLTTPQGNILDVGCGLGFFVKAVMEQRSGWEAVGYEMSQVAVNYAREQNKLVNVFSGMVQTSELKKGSIDVITLWDVIEHIPKPQPLMEYLFDLLKPGGFIFLQTPNFPIQLWKARLKVRLKGMQKDGHYLEAKDHINDYTRKTMNLLAKQCKFQTPEYYVLPPILSVSGSKSNLGKYGKLGYYHLTKVLWYASFKTLFLNNTLFALIRK